MTTNVMRLLPQFVSILMEQAYSTDASVELIIRRKDHTGLVHVTARYEDETMFNELLDIAKQKLKKL